MTTTRQALQIERVGAVATIWMNRPEIFNAFNEELIDELTQTFTVLNDDASVRVVILAGRGRHFSAGADLNWMKRASAASQSENLDDARRFAAMLHRISTLSKPTIARVHGMALGGGTGLAAACDIAVAADDAVFSTSEVRFGIIPSVISPYVIRAIGPRQALRFFQTAEQFSAQRALMMGLVSETHSFERLDEGIAVISNALLAGGPHAQAAAKDLIAVVSRQPIDTELMEETAQRIARQRATPEAKDGIAAFLEKRPPAWSS